MYIYIFMFMLYMYYLAGYCPIPLYRGLGQDGVMWVNNGSMTQCLIFDSFFLFFLRFFLTRDGTIYLFWLCLCNCSKILAGRCRCCVQIGDFTLWIDFCECVCTYLVCLFVHCGNQNPRLGQDTCRFWGSVRSRCLPPPLCTAFFQVFSLSYKVTFS